MSPVDIHGKGIPGGGDSTCKGPEVGRWSACSRKSKKAHVLQPCGAGVVRDWGCSVEGFCFVLSCLVLFCFVLFLSEMQSL